jgi:hypothetical protein
MATTISFVKIWLDDSLINYIMASMLKDTINIVISFVTLTSEFLFRTFILQMLKLVNNIHIHDVHIQK